VMVEGRDRKQVGLLANRLAAVVSRVA